MMILRKWLSLVFLLVIFGFLKDVYGGIVVNPVAEAISVVPGREHIKMDFDWRFAFGHPYDTQKDFNHGTGYFSYLAKAGYGDGAAAADFDDRAWRKLDLPHDWAVEQPFNKSASLSHGFKAIGRGFPETTIGWYRKKFSIPATDLGRRISIAFDGIYRNAKVWVNGHYLGTEPSGYLGFEYNISEYLSYGGENVIAVRVDAGMEEGWFYEGAGIYRHVWLNKTDPLHIATNGIFVHSQIDGKAAIIHTTATIQNDGSSQRRFNLVQNITDRAGKVVQQKVFENISISPYSTKDVQLDLPVKDAQLWSVDTPYLYRLITKVEEDGRGIDSYKTRFGFRSMYFDANAGFFLNGKHLEIKGTNNHQDHAGVGTALPDALQAMRIRILKDLGSNAYRCSHNPPTPELLDACDSLGMLVIDENRLMGASSTQLQDLKRLIVRDRNHPSVISWSIGNEEWGIENNQTGAAIAKTMQQYCLSLDSTRYVTAAFSGGVGSGISNVMEVLGYNYVANKNTDAHHKAYPKQLSWGTEEGSTVTSRGIYIDDTARHLLSAYDRKQNDNFLSLEDGWKYYAARPYLAGMFIWTGFDYRGEPTPFGWPSVYSYFGMVDACGFPKDDAWYLRSWWGNKPVIHILPHWNWKGKEGDTIPVWVYSNCSTVELFLNKRSLGKKTMPKNGHLEWNVKYQPGTLEAVGVTESGQLQATDRATERTTISTTAQTTGAAVALHLSTDQSRIKADRADIALVAVSVLDKDGHQVPTASSEVKFTITGPGKIIGVGSGDQTSLEADKYLDRIQLLKIDRLKEKVVEGPHDPELVKANYDDRGWDKAFSQERDSAFGRRAKAIVYRGVFDMPADAGDATVTFFYKSIGALQSVYVNGQLMEARLPANPEGNVFKLDKAILHSGLNSVAIQATPLIKEHSWDVINQSPGLIQLVYPAAPWKRRLFSGLAQVIVQSTGAPGKIQLTAESRGLKKKTIIIKAEAAVTNKAKDKVTATHPGAVSEAQELKL